MLIKPRFLSGLPATLRVVLIYGWVAPATLVGLLLALIARATGGTAVVVDGVIEVAGGGVRKLVSRQPIPFRFQAITFGHVVIGVDHAVLTRCRAHEHVHVRQYERWGILFFPLYLGSSLLQILGGRHFYWDNHFERQARQRENASSQGRSW